MTMKFLLSAFALLTLSSCAYFQVDEQAREVALKKNDEPAVAVQTAVPAPDLGAVIRSQSEGRVEFFPLDAPLAVGPVPSAPADFKVESAPQSVAPAVMSDPSVTVFPLDGGSLPPLAAPGPVSSLAPVTDAANAIFFARSVSDLSDEDRMKIDSVVRTLPGGMIAVEGFASTESSIQDPVRRKIVNLQMSMDRALAVSGYLIESGTPAERILTIARGEALAGEDAAQSRRVEIRPAVQ